MRIKQKPEDFVVREAYRFDETRKGEFNVYLMDKQKLSTFEAIERIARAHKLKTKDFSFCGLKDKQGRTEQIIAVRGARVELQEPDLRLKFLGRTDAPLSAKNLTANRFVVTVRDLTLEEAERVPASVDEVLGVGLVNYFDSQRFGGLKHGQGFLAKDLLNGRVEHALKGYMAHPSELDQTEDAKVKAFWAKNWGDWSARCPFPRVAHYRPVLRKLRENPKDFVGAFLAIDKRYRGLLLFEYQSYLFNESVRRYLLGRLGSKGHLELRYQAGGLLFPRRPEDPSRLEGLKGKPFPLLGPETIFDDPEIEKAVADTLKKERLTLQKLGIPKIPEMGMRHEDRPLVIVPPKLSVVDPRPDELNRGRVKVSLAFTLPPGAYATLLVRRTLWFAMEDVERTGGELPEADRRFVPRRVRDSVESISDRARHSHYRQARPPHGLAVVDSGAAPAPEGYEPRRGRGRGRPERGEAPWEGERSRGRGEAPWEREERRGPGERGGAPERGGRRGAPEREARGGPPEREGRRGAPEEAPRVKDRWRRRVSAPGEEGASKGRAKDVRKVPGKPARGKDIGKRRVPTSVRKAAEAGETAGPQAGVEQETRAPVGKAAGAKGKGAGKPAGKSKGPGKAPAKAKGAKSKAGGKASSARSKAAGKPAGKAAGGAKKSAKARPGAPERPAARKKGARDDDR